MKRASNTVAITEPDTTRCSTLALENIIWFIYYDRDIEGQTV